MQSYDVVMLLVLIGATIFGFWKGMAWQIASVASLVVSYFVALQFADQLAPSFASFAPPPLNKFVAMLVIYMATSFVIWTLFRFVSGVIDRVKMEYFDRQMGAIFGFAKGVLLCVAITFFAVSLLPQQQKEVIIASQTGRNIVVMLHKTETVVPPEIHQVLRPLIDRIERQLDPNYRGPGMGQDFQSLWPQGIPMAVPTQQPAAQTHPQPIQTGPETQAPAHQWIPPQTADRPSGGVPY